MTKGMFSIMIEISQKNSNPQASASASRESKFNRPQRELDHYIEQQAQTVAPEPVDSVAARLRSMNHWQVKENLLRGEIYSQKKQSFKKLKEFKAWLEQQGFTWKNACKLIKLHETFSSFPLEQIEWVDISTLFALVQPKYQQLLQQMRSLPKWTDAQVQELMQGERQRQKVQKPQPQSQPQAKKGTGWRQVPGGGRAYQLPLLHEDWLGVLIDKVRELKNQTLAQLVGEMTRFYVERGQVPGISIKGLEIPKQLPSSDLPGYIPYARSQKDCAHNAKLLQQKVDGILSGTTIHLKQRQPI
jgi:hypothetical protein